MAEGWCFDTELQTLAERSGRRIHEVPVDWVDDAGSLVDAWATSLAGLRDSWRLRRRSAAARRRLVEAPEPDRDRLLALPAPRAQPVRHPRPHTRSHPPKSPTRLDERDP